MQDKTIVDHEFNWIHQHYIYKLLNYKFLNRNDD